MSVFGPLADKKQLRKVQEKVSRQRDCHQAYDDWAARTISHPSSLMPSARTEFIVFLIDDDPAILKALGRLLRAGGYQTKAYQSAEVFLNEHDASIPGCAVLDHAMPGLNGLDVQEVLPCNLTCCSRIPLRSPAPCSGKPARSRSYSSTSPTQSAQVLFSIWRGRAAISLVCCTTR